MVKTEVLDRHGRSVGKYVAERIGQPDLEDQVERDFVYISCEPGRGNGAKIVHALEVEQKGGIWYRVDAADIEEEAWNEAVVREELVLLG